jgi:outer membrane protein assembly factor BamB
MCTRRTRRPAGSAGPAATRNDFSNDFSLVLAGSTVYAEGHDGHVDAVDILNAATGTVRWTYATSPSPYVVVAGGTVYASDGHGTLSAIRAPT